MLPPQLRRVSLEHVYLIYLVNLFAQPAFLRGSWFEWLTAALIIALFLPLYFRTNGLRRQQLQSAWLIALLGFGSSFLNVGASVLYIYSAAALALLLPRQQALRAFLLLSVTAVIQAVLVLLLFDTYFVLLPFGFAVAFIWVIGLANLTERERQQAATSLQRAQDEINQLATIAERERISRDMHDVLGHSLSVVILRSELAVRLAENAPHEAAAEMRAVEQIAREALQEVRSAINGYRVAGLIGEIANVRRALGAAGVELEEDVPAALALPLQLETVLALALREAVTNVIRHAAARQCRVKLEVLAGAEGDSVRMEVSDDGRGGDTPEGDGLQGMRQRISAQGGTMLRNTGSGTALVITVPLP